MTKGNIKCLPCANPVRLTVEKVRLTVENAYLTSKAEAGQDWTTFLTDKPSLKIENSAAPNEASSKPRNRRDEPATSDESLDEDIYSDEDTLLSPESSEEELSTCGKLFKRFRQMFTNSRRCCCVAAAIAGVIVVAVVVVVVVVVLTI